MRAFSTLILVVAISLSSAPALAQWGSTSSLYTQDGVEVSIDPRVFSVFAMLNALGCAGTAPMRRATTSAK